MKTWSTVSRAEYRTVPFGTTWWQLIAMAIGTVHASSEQQHRGTLTFSLNSDTIMFSSCGARWAKKGTRARLWRDRNRRLYARNRGSLASGFEPGCSDDKLESKDDAGDRAAVEQ
jgi:hypothetical protein